MENKFGQWRKSLHLPDLGAGIYVLFNHRTQKFYIGCTTNFRDRWQTCWACKLPPLMEVDYQKGDEIEMRVLEVVKCHDFPRLFEIEKLYISILKPHYNIKNIRRKHNASQGK